ncbi:hypothetical protein Hanom_Chr02g00137741 [Helianthus anomalus]
MRLLSAILNIFNHLPSIADVQHKWTQINDKWAQINARYKLTRTLMSLLNVLWTLCCIIILLLYVCFQVLWWFFETLYGLLSLILSFIVWSTFILIGVLICLCLFNQLPFTGDVHQKWSQMDAQYNLTRTTVDMITRFNDIEATRIHIWREVEGEDEGEEDESKGKI